LLTKRSRFFYHGKKSADASPSPRSTSPARCHPDGNLPLSDSLTGYQQRSSRTVGAHLLKYAPAFLVAWRRAARDHLRRALDGQVYWLGTPGAQPRRSRNCCRTPGRLPPQLFIVSQVVSGLRSTLRSYPERIAARPVPSKSNAADGKKCERCWNYSTHVSENPRYPTVCERCSEALAEIEKGALGNQPLTLCAYGEVTMRTGTLQRRCFGVPGEYFSESTRTPAPALAVAYSRCRHCRSRHQSLVRDSHHGKLAP